MTADNILDGAIWDGVLTAETVTAFSAHAILELMHAIHVDMLSQVIVAAKIMGLILGKHRQQLVNHVHVCSIVSSTVHGKMPSHIQEVCSASRQLVFDPGPLLCCRSNVNDSS
mmetsp:Transcript_30316/g.80607  ORF Transcript_30316/g.80607 Transcript_30316/m.80607 type:complete len:113 (-) Transcript_30316:493-831(-)